MNGDILNPCKKCGAHPEVTSYSDTDRFLDDIDGGHEYYDVEEYVCTYCGYSADTAEEWNEPED